MFDYLTDKNLKKELNNITHDWWLIKKKHCKCTDDKSKPNYGFKEDRKVVCCSKCKEPDMIHLYKYKGSF